MLPILSAVSSSKHGPAYGLPNHKHIFFLFTEDRVCALSADAAENSVRLPLNTWALTDSNASVGPPCEAFLAAAGGTAWVVQATSPKRSRWYEWHKQMQARLYVMDVVSEVEMKAFG